MTPVIKKPFVDLFGDVVAAVETALLPYLKTVDPKIQVVHYQHGHPREITNTLSEMNRPQEYQFRKYPVIALFEDIREQKAAIPGFDFTASCNLIIANQTEATYKSADRHAKNFNPILVPLYDELLQRIAAHPAFRFDREKDKGERFKRVNWGKEGLYGSEQNVFKDRLDCIEVRGLTISYKEGQCYTTKFSTI